MSETVRLRMVVTIDYDADPDSYYFDEERGYPAGVRALEPGESPDPVEMAAIDQAQWNLGSLQASDFDDPNDIVTAVFGPAPDESLSFFPGGPSHITTKPVRFNGLHEMISDE